MTQWIGRRTPQYAVASALAMLLCVPFVAADEPRPNPKREMSPLRSPDQILNTPDGVLVPRPVEIDFRPVHFFVRPRTQVVQIADALLSVGMQPEEVSKVLKERQITADGCGSFGVSMTNYYRTQNPEDPLLVVEFRRDSNRIYRVREWSTEKMASESIAAEPPRRIQRMAFGPRPPIFPPSSTVYVQYRSGASLPPPPPTTTTADAFRRTFRRTFLRVHSQEQVQQIADSSLKIGMPSDEVSEILEEQSLIARRMSSSVMGMTTSYAGGELEDTLLVVRFRRDSNGISRVMDWSAEK